MTKKEKEKKAYKGRFRRKIKDALYCDPACPQIKKILGDKNAWCECFDTALYEDTKGYKRCLWCKRHTFIKDGNPV